MDTYGEYFIDFTLLLLHNNVRTIDFMDTITVYMPNRYVCIYEVCAVESICL